MIDLTPFIDQRITVECPRHSGKDWIRFTGKLQSINPDKGTALFRYVNLNQCQLIDVDANGAVKKPSLGQKLNGTAAKVLGRLCTLGSPTVPYMGLTDGMRVVQTHQSKP